MDSSTVDPETLVTQKCPDCGAAWANDDTCHDYFLQMLFWENDNPELGSVHHLMVLCYHLQHPRLYSSEGLAYGKKLLVEFVERGTTTAQIRRRNGRQLSSSNRQWKVKGTPQTPGSYQQPVSWTMTAADVIGAGIEHYCDKVQAWARATLVDLKASGNLNST